MAEQKEIPWVDYTYEKFAEIFQEFQLRQQNIRGVTIKVRGGENNLPAKVLLRYYQTPRDVEMSASLCNDLFAGKEVSFFTTLSDGTEREIFHFVYGGGGDITAKFDNCPWLLDILFDMAQGLLIKKLTPPSSVFGTLESGSEGSESPRVLTP